MKAPSRAGLLLAVLLLAAATGLGQSASLSKLSSKERADRVKALPEDDRRWLTEYVEPIVLPEEVNLFLQLTEPHQHDAFKAEFWKRGGQAGLPAPLGPGYEARYAHLREAAATQYDGLNSDTGKMVVRQGEPDSVQDLSMDCSEVYRQAEIWNYTSQSAGSGQIQHIFYRPSLGAPRRLLTSGDSAIFQTASCFRSFGTACTLSQNPKAPLVANCEDRPQGPNSLIPAPPPKTCAAACALARASGPIDMRGKTEEGYMAKGPAVSTEGLDTIWQRLASVSDPRAKPIAAQNVP